ncbi:MAG: hypothetical protein KJ597_04365 [Nanoarchaeota archaeon]|nr:hypothetical protein [Nanoarchaeota archaeon]MBU1622782.1 hypothetical protein [Nanoarchaeota archaeon]
MQKKWLLPLMFLITVPAALADVMGTLKDVWEGIISVGSLSVLGLSDGSVVLGLTRLLIWILMFAVFFAVMTGIKTPPFKFLSRGQAGVVAAVLATISAIFLPDAVLGATGVGWATAIALVLIGGPIIGLAYLLMKFPGKDNETKWTVFIKIIICLLLFWILSAMKVHITGLGI